MWTAAASLRKGKRLKKAEKGWERPKKDRHLPDEDWVHHMIVKLCEALDGGVFGGVALSRKRKNKKRKKRKREKEEKKKRKKGKKERKRKRNRNANASSQLNINVRDISYILFHILHNKLLVSIEGMRLGNCFTVTLQLIPFLVSSQMIITLYGFL